MFVYLCLENSLTYPSYKYFQLGFFFYFLVTSFITGLSSKNPFDFISGSKLNQFFICLLVFFIGEANLGLRLVDGNSSCSGRVEVKFQERWGTICDDGWNSNTAAVVCRQLGCPSSFISSGVVDSPAVLGPIWLDDIICQGNELAIWNCRHRGWGNHDCSHYEDVTLTCYGKSPRHVEERNNLFRNSMYGKKRVNHSLEKSFLWL